jgi:Bifunctional DNA primase/polymerase, N-terminal
MRSPFSQWAESYVERGFSPMPVHPGRKWTSFAGKNIKKWQHWCDAPAKKTLMKFWVKADCAGICLACGYRGLVVIDVDDARAYPAVREVLGNARAPVKVGQRGASAFFVDPTGAIASKDFTASTDHDGKTLVQILAKGRQTVIPPTIHPDTRKPYRWVGQSLETCTVDQLPVITQTHIDEIGRLLAPLLPKPRPVERPILSLKPKKPDVENFELHRYNRWGQQALKTAVSDLSNQQRPGRNRRLFAICCGLGWLVHHQIVKHEDFVDAMLFACKSNGLIDTDGEKHTLVTITRGLKISQNDELPSLDRGRAA